jgi:hypothetical protein
VGKPRKCKDNEKFYRARGSVALWIPEKMASYESRWEVHMKPKLMSLTMLDIPASFKVENIQLGYNQCPICGEHGSSRCWSRKQYFGQIKRKHIQRTYGSHYNGDFEYTRKKDLYDNESLWNE